jgi:ubiquitin-conjugating enzyme E2 Q
MMWDDGLVDAWKEDRRIVLLVKVPTYPPRPGQMEFYLGLDDRCEQEI